MELLQLRYFYDSAKTGSFAKTAEKYIVPATSVSAAVKRLERELGCSLFDRTNNRIILNENGKRLQQSLCVIFEELDTAVNSLSPDLKTDKREITILVRAIRGTMTDYLIEYRKINPQINFKTVFSPENDDYEKYDIIIDEESNKYPDCSSFPLCRMQINIKAAADSPLCGKPLTLIQLRNHHFITFGEQTGLHKLLTDACREVGFTPNIAVQTNDNSCHRKWVSSGLVLGLSRNFPGMSSNGITQALDVKDFKVFQTICVNYKNQAAYGNVQHFLDFMKSKATK